MFYLNISSTDFFKEKQIAKPLHFEEIIYMLKIHLSRIVSLGEVGGAKLLSHRTPLNYRSGQKKQFKPRAAMHHAISAKAQHDGI